MPALPSPFQLELGIDGATFLNGSKDIRYSAPCRFDQKKGYSLGLAQNKQEPEEFVLVQ